MNGRWRLVVGGEDGRQPGVLPGAYPGARNMAVDQALLESVALGAAPVFRLYRWRPACLSFGRNQPAAELYDAPRAHAAGIEIVRRPTGGLGVLHDAELTYAVVVPAPLLGGPRATYRTINLALAQGLRTIGIDATVADGARRPRAAAFATAAPCFEAPAAGEVVVDGRKLVGSAQRVERGAILQHGSILLDGTQSIVQRLRVCGDAARAPEIRATSVRALLGRVPDCLDLVGALVTAWERMVGTALAPAALEPADCTRARVLEAHFGDPAWTWRR